MFYQNMSGMTSQLTRFHRILENCTYDVVILTETWLRSHHLDPEIASSSWQIARFDRPNEGRGGGVLIAIRSSIPCSSINIEMTNQDVMSFQQCWMKILLDTKDVYLGCFYMKPNQNSDHYFDFVNAASTILNSMKTEDICFIFGDFNLPGLKWNKIEEDDCIYAPSNITTELQERFLQFFAEQGLGQLCNLENQSGNVLDLVFTNAVDNFELKEIDSIFHKTSVHHKCFEVKFLYAYENLTEATSSKTIYDFNNADYKRISEYLQTIILHPNLNIDQMAEYFVNELCTVINLFVPRKIIIIRNKAPWHDSTYFRLKNRRNKEFKRWRENNSEQQKLNFLQCREELENYDNHAYELYVRESANKIKQNPKEFWKCIDYKRQTNGYPSSMSYKNEFKHDKKDICKLFKEFFQTVYEEPQTTIAENFSDIPNSSDYLTDIIINRDDLLNELKNLDKNKGPGPDGIPTMFLKNIANYIVDPLLTIFNYSLKEGYFPRKWRTSNVTPIFKSGDRSKVENYRGIAILSVIPKLFERIVTEHIVRFLTGKLNDHQHGFQQGRSTTTNLSYYVSHLLLSRKIINKLMLYIQTSRKLSIKLIMTF